MTLDSQGIVSVVELVFYLPCVIGAVIICSRHGFTRSSGWIYTLILCLVRIVGSVCCLVSLNSPSANLLEATLILEFIGISPLLFATLGVLSRYVDWTNIQSQGFFNVKVFRVLQLLILLGMILSIVGGVNSFSSSSSDSNDSTTTAQTSPESEAGVILYVLAFAGILIILISSLPKLNSVPKAERMLAVAVALAAPLLLVRIIYAICTVFIHDSTFNALTGSVLVKGVMAVLEELVVVAIYILVGFRLEKLSQEQQGEILSRPWKAKNGKKGGKVQGGSRAPGQFVGMIGSRLNDRLEHRLGVRVGGNLPNPSGPASVDPRVRHEDRGQYPRAPMDSYPAAQGGHFDEHTAMYP